VSSEVLPIQRLAHLLVSVPLVVRDGKLLEPAASITSW
jgi:hypothetical protein